MNTAASGTLSLVLHSMRNLVLDIELIPGVFGFFVGFMFFLVVSLEAMVVLVVSMVFLEKCLLTQNAVLRTKLAHL